MMFSQKNKKLTEELRKVLLKQDIIDYNIINLGPAEFFSRNLRHIFCLYLDLDQF